MLDFMVEGLRPGDTVRVARLNRLGRSTRHVLELMARFAELQVRFVSLDLGVDTATPASKMMVGVFAVLAEYNRDSASVPALEQVRISHVATPTSGVEVPRPRFYTRWRGVHGRWYHFTYQAGDKRVMIPHPDPGRRSNEV